MYEAKCIVMDYQHHNAQLQAQTQQHLQQLQSLAPDSTRWNQYQQFWRHQMLMNGIDDFSTDHHRTCTRRVARTPLFPPTRPVRRLCTAELDVRFSSDRGISLGPVCVCVTVIFFFSEFIRSPWSDDMTMVNYSARDSVGKTLLKYRRLRANLKTKNP